MVIGLLEGPAIWEGMVDIGHGRKRVRRNIFDIGGIGIQAMTKLSISSERGLRFGGEGGTKLGQARQARARLHGRDGDERDFKGHNFIRLQRKVGKNEWRVILAFDPPLLMTHRKTKNSN